MLLNKIYKLIHVTFYVQVWPCEKECQVSLALDAGQEVPG